METVHRVAEAGSFAAAARSLGVDPSTISRSVALVERRLGFRIFQRSTRQLSPTEAGAIWLARTAPALQELALAGEAAAGVVAGPSGTLRLTASVAFGQVRLVPLLERLRTALPDLALELILSDANLDLIAERIDLAIRLAPAPRGDLVSARLLRTRYLVVAAPAWVHRHGAPDAPASLAAHDCLLMDLPAYRSAWTFRDASAAIEEVPVDGPIRISSPLAIRAAALNGLGPALLADWLVGADLDARALVDLFPRHEVTATTFDTGAWALYPSRAFLPAKTRAALDFLRASLRTGIG